MAEFNIRTDSVDVEQIMRQIRARIKEKRGVDYTEQQIQELANVKLERFLDPKGVRSDLIEQFKRTRGTSPAPPNYVFEDTTLYETHRGILRFIRKLLNPILKLFFNPNRISHVLHLQGQVNTINAQQFSVREELDALYYEVIHNLVLEVTRLGIEAKNLKMRLESLSSRMDFDERRARALEGVVQYRSGTGPAREPQQDRGRPHARQSQAAQAPRPAFAEASAGGPPAVGAPAPAQQRQQTQQGTVSADQTGTGQPDVGAALGDQAGAARGSVEVSGPDAAAGLGTSSTARRRRRRRRGRRGGRGRSLGENAAMPGTATAELAPDQSATPPHGDPTADAALDREGSESESDAWGRDEEPDPEAQ
jgi:hypothetical protein